MFSKRIGEVGNPLIYIFFTLAVSCISYGINEEFRGLTIIIVTFFFICMLYYCGVSFTCIMIIFFTAGILMNFLYYKIPSKVNGEIRITKVSSYSTIGNYEGKNITIETNKKNLNLGEKYKIIGTVKNIQDKSNGIVGELEPQTMYKVNGDLITRLYEIKRNIYLRLEENLGKRKAGLIASIAFGYSDYLDSEDKDDMKNFGVIHSISVSGLHVAIVYGFLRIFMGSNVAILATMIYVIFTGSNYSSIRAFLMLACVEGGHLLKRNNNSISALCFSAIFLVIYQPYSIFNISFHLTYLATLGIIMFNKKFNDILYKLNPKLRESLSLTLSAQVFTLPYLILIFKDFSVNFIIGNLFLVPFVDLIVITGNILVLVYTWPKLFDFCSYINLNIINAFDWMLNTIDKFSLPMFYGNENVVFFYLFLIFSFYFVIKGYKNFVYLPLIAIFVIGIQVYSPIPSIRYYEEGAILFSYKGERILITNKNQIDLKRLSEATFATKAFRQRKPVNVSGICKISLQEKNYILETNKEKYLLKATSDKNEHGEYDIINFDNRVNKNIFIINGNII
jgi:competence protein ComEC